MKFIRSIRHALLDITLSFALVKYRKFIYRTLYSYSMTKILNIRFQSTQNGVLVLPAPIHEEFKGKTIYKCNDCSYQTDRINNYQRHLGNDHSKGQNMKVKLKYEGEFSCNLHDVN